MICCAFWAASSLALPLCASQKSVIPQPMRYQQTEGSFLLKRGSFVFAQMNLLPQYLNELNQASGLDLKRAPADVACSIQFLSGGMRGRTSVDHLQPLADEAYELRITPHGVRIYADSSSGHYYGLQTLLQLIHGSEKTASEVTLPCVEIKDAPRFVWRGFMLDESREFSGENAVKRLLDVMAYYKLNKFHWHLTDSSGWRIEIKKYPKLTAIGGVGNHHDPKAPAQFYTQQQIREIVAYAKARHITVIPEIDMPGHAAAAVRAYPEFGGGGSKKHPDFTFNPADPATDAFLNDILREVAGLFPEAEVIHFGGDEVHFGWEKWSSLPQVAQLMHQEKLTLKEVEKRFNQRFAKVINELGFKTGGWDEISHAGLPPEKSLVFWWRHDKMKELNYSLKHGFDVVLCPRLPCYFDFVQDKSHTLGRRWAGKIVALEDTYGFPDSLKLPQNTKGRVIGIQGNLWTETTQTQEQRDFMTFPRLLALAEAAWTPKRAKEFSSFELRLKSHLPQLKARGIHYFDPFAQNSEVKK